MEHTGAIIGDKQTALLINPKSAYVIKCQCKYGCTPGFYVAGRIWIDEVDQATIFRTYEAGQAALMQAREILVGCLKDATFDVIPLMGYVNGEHK